MLQENVEDNPRNFTRFFLLVPPSSPPPEADASARWKTSLMLRVANNPGALYRALGALAMHEIDMAKIESRPIEGRPWEYAFYLDIIGRQDEPNVAHALSNLTRMAELVKVLGSYPTRW